MHRSRILSSLLLVGMVLSLLTLSNPFGLRTAEAQACSSPNWEGKFYASVDFTGTVASTNCNAVIDFDWGPGAPVAGVGFDNFSVRWTSTQNFPTAGTYLFTVTVEDGVRLYVNGTPLINAMNDSDTVRTLTASYTVAAAGSTAFITLEMANYVGNAQLKLVWALTSGAPPPNTNTTSTTTTTTTGTTGTTTTTTGGGVSVVNAPAPPPDGGGHQWEVQFFNNPNLEGSPVTTVAAVADGISRNYDINPPADGVPADGWSARWTRAVVFPEGIYDFTLRADDASRVTIDNIEILNQASFVHGVSFVVSVKIPAGSHQIVVEFRDDVEFANLFLTWDPPVGTTLLPDGCNGETAGINGSAEACPGKTAVFAAQQTTAAAGAQPVTMNVTVRAGPLNFRPEPKKESGRISMLHRGEQYTAIGRSGDNVWLELEAGGVTGWAMVEFLTPTGDINTLAITDGTAPATTQVTTLPAAGDANAGVSVVTNAAPAAPSIPNVQARALGNMRLRSGPSNNFDRVASIPWGAVVKVIGVSADNKWLQLDFDGVQGWSSRDWFQVFEGDLSALPVTN